MKLGIDYGTTTTLVSYTPTRPQGSKPSLLNIGENRSGYLRSSIPSIIGVRRDAEDRFVIGYEAEELAKSAPKDSIVLRSLKRCLACEIEKDYTGKDCLNPANRQFCLGAQKLKLFNCTMAAREMVKIFIEGVLKLSPIRSLIEKEGDSFNLGISVPAIFGSEPRRTIYDLLLNCFDDRVKIDVVNEPTAAIIACRESMSKEEDGIYVICDVGGGTTDIVVFEKRGDSYFLFRPTGVQVAGDDIDNTLMKHLYHPNNKESNNDTVLVEIRRAKEHLTVMKEVTLFGKTLSRVDFENIVEPVLKQIVGKIREAIKVVFDAHKPYRDTGQRFRLKTIYMSGGGSKIPLFKRLIAEDENISFGAEVAFVKNDELYPIYKDDLPIVVVALGTSSPRGGISDAIQYMLPYAIYVRTARTLEEKVPIYSALPVEFDVRGAGIHILAAEPGSPKNPVYDLTEELVSTPETQEMLLSEFITKSGSFHIEIDRFNIMRVSTADSVRRKIRPFPLPWQGGIEPSLFEKYRRAWRLQHGL